MDAGSTDRDVGSMALDEDLDARASGDIQVLEFAVDGETFAVDVDELVLIDEDVAVTRLPRSPEGIVGITDMRGDVTAVIDPGAVLGVEAAEDRRYLLVTGGRGERQKVGLGVDDVDRVRGYDDANLDDGDELAELDSEGLDRDVVEAVIRRDDGDGVSLVALLSLDAVVEAVAQDRRAASFG